MSAATAHDQPSDNTHPDTTPAVSPSPSALVAARINRRSRERSMEALRRLLSTVVDADTWDEGVYFTRPPGDWVMLTRDSWADMKAAVEAVDAYRPWEP